MASKSPITLPKRGNTSEGQCQRDHWKAEKFLAQHCNVPAGTCVSCDVRNHRLHNHPSRSHLLCNLLYYRSTNHSHRDSTRSIRTHTTIEVPRENETAGHAHNNHSPVACRDYHDCTDVRLQLYCLDALSPISLPHRRRTLHPIGSSLFDLYDRSHETTAPGRTSSQSQQFRKNDQLNQGKTR